jgi:hypothetical protein
MAKVYDNPQEAAEASTFFFQWSSMSPVILVQQSLSSSLCMSWLACTCEPSYFLSESAIHCLTSHQLGFRIEPRLGLLYHHGKAQVSLHISCRFVFHHARANDFTPQGTALHGVSFVYLMHRHITVHVP